MRDLDVFVSVISDVVRFLYPAYDLFYWFF
jgi:hypothetical protein